MSNAKQSKPIRRNCQHGECVRDAVIGIYGWNPGDTIVNLDKPLRVVCGEHKPRWDGRYNRRNVRLLT